MEACCESVKEFLEDVKEEYGERHATLIIRSVCGFDLKNSEVETTHLPLSFSKRRLYEKWCYYRGYKIRSDMKGRYGALQGYELQANDDVL